MDRRKELYNLRKENHLCVKCGKPNDSTTVCCSNCREKINKYGRESRLFFKENGICPRCRKNRIFKNENECVECRAGHLTFYYEHRKNNDGYKNNKSIYGKEVRQQCTSQGICVMCRKNKAIPGKTKCMRCTQKYNAYFRKYYERDKITSGELTRHERVENGLCYYCGEKIDVIGKRACSKCCKEYSTHFNQEIRPANYWKNDNAMVFVSKAQREAIEMGNSKNVYHAKPYYLTSMSGGGT